MNKISTESVRKKLRENSSCTLNNNENNVDCNIEMKKPYKKTGFLLFLRNRNFELCKTY